jgi:DNA ligase (NAD+)
VGDFVFLEKAGEIIPEIIGVDPSRRPAPTEPYVFPAKCPECGSPVIAAEDAADARCSNSTSCPAQLHQRLVHFAGKSCVAIKGLGEATIAKLIASGQAKNPADLYTLKLETLTSVAGFGKKSATQLLTEIDRSRHAKLWRFINGLSISRVGPASAKILARRFESLEKLVAAQPTDLPVELGDAARQSVLTFFNTPENRMMVIELSKAVQPSDVASSNSSCDGKVFVLTGQLPTLSREETTRRIEAAGGKVRDGVSKSTDYVVAGTDPGEKAINAKNLNVPVLDEEELLELLGD